MAISYKPSTPYTGSLPNKTVKKGNRNSDVKAVQKFLNWCIKASLAVDGYCGSKTVAAIKKYQKWYGLKQDGVFGNQSKKKAQAIIKQYQAKPTPTPTPEPTPTPTPEPTPAPVYKTKQDLMLEWAQKIAADNNFHYVKWTKTVKTHECPICCKHSKGAYYGWNCIGYAWASWRHGAGLASRCSCGVISNAQYEKILTASASDALKLAQQRIGIKDIQLLRSKSGIALSKLKPGDVIAYFKGNKYVHTAIYIGNGLIADCTSGRKDQIKYGAKSYTSMTIKLAFRYTGK